MGISKQAPIESMPSKNMHVREGRHAITQQMTSTPKHIREGMPAIAQPSIQGIKKPSNPPINTPIIPPISPKPTAKRAITIASRIHGMPNVKIERMRRRRVTIARGISPPRRPKTKTATPPHAPTIPPTITPSAPVHIPTSAPSKVHGITKVQNKLMATAPKQIDGILKKHPYIKLAIIKSKSIIT
jgi:hypothetical protein